MLNQIYFPVSADQIKVSDWRALAKKQTGDGSSIELTVQPDSDPSGPGQSILNLITGRFNPQLLVDAADAVGGKPQFFLGMGRFSSCFPSLLVFPTGWRDDGFFGPIALVLSLRFEEVAHMTEKHTFPVSGCSSCPHYQVVGRITRYCNGFKRRKAKRFKSSDPKFKAPKWCPKRISPPIYRIYGYVDECSEYIEIMHRVDFEMGRSKIISPSPSHYKPKAELSLGKTAKQFFDATQEEPLSDILPVEVEPGEIIEIDDGLQPYYFYMLNSFSVVPLPYYHLLKGDDKK